MPNWKKLIVSGSDAALHSLTVTNGITGSLLGNASTATTASYALNADTLDDLNSSDFVRKTGDVDESIDGEKHFETKVKIGGNSIVATEVLAVNSTTAGGTTIGTFTNATMTDTSSPANSVYGGVTRGIYTGASTIGSIIGQNNIGRYTGTGAASFILGAYNQADYNSTSTSNVTNMFSSYNLGSISNTGTSTIDLAYNNFSNLSVSNPNININWLASNYSALTLTSGSFTNVILNYLNLQGSISGTDPNVTIENLYYILANDTETYTTSGESYFIKSTVPLPSTLAGDLILTNTSSLNVSGTITGSTAQLTGIPSGTSETNIILTDGSGNLVTRSASSLSVASASYAVSASHVIGGVDPFPYTGSAQITGSLNVTGSVGFSALLAGGNAWSAGGALSTARYALAGAGTQNAGLAFGGYSPSRSCTEEYDGTSWSAGGALITARFSLAGAGTQNAGLAFGGYVLVTPPFSVSCTEEYDGTSWSAGGALSTARCGLAGAGEQNAALAFGGFFAPTSRSCTEEYNGSAWSTGGALITARNSVAGAGTQTAALAFGGNIVPTNLSCTEEYDGSSWSAGGALSTARYSLAGAGTQNAALAFGGAAPTNESCTEEYDGSSWSTGGALITARYSLAGAGTQNAGLAFGGSPGPTPSTEEYSPGLVNTKTFDYSSTTGETTVSCLIETSAERYKSNIQPLGSQLSKVMQLQPVEFDWKTNKKHDIGFVADSVKDIYPNLVSTNAQGEVEGMNYSKLVSALVKSIQEQQFQINELQTKINKLNIN